MKTRTPLVLAVLALLLLSPAVAADAPRFESLLDADVDMIVLIDDVPALLAAWPASPLGRAWTDPQMKKFLAPLRESIQIDRWEEIVREGTGHALSEILAGFTGQAALVLPDFRALRDEDEDARPVMAFVAEVGREHEIVRKLMAVDLDSTRAKQPEGTQVDEVEEEFQGETLYVRKETSEESVLETEGWAIVDNLVVMAEPKSLLQQLVATIKKKSADRSLAAAPTFAKLRARTPASNVLFYINAKKLVPVLVEEMKGEMADDAAGSPLGITPDAVLDALALDVLEGLYLSVRIAAKATEMDFGLLYGEDRGLIRLLAFQPGPATLPDFVPHDAVSADTANFSIPQAWAAAKELMQVISPGVVGMLDMQLQQFAGEAGFHPEKALVSSLGDRIVSVDMLPPPKGPGERPSVEEVRSVVAISVTDSQTLQMALDGLLGMTGVAGMFEKRDYLDATLNVLKQPNAEGEAAAGKHFTFALTDGYLLLSDAEEPVQSLVSRIKRPSRSLWQRPEVKAALATLPGNASGVSFNDVKAIVSAAIEAMATFQELEEDEDKFCDPSAKPDPAVIEKYFGLAVSGTYKEPGGLYSTFRLLHPE